MIRKSSFAFIFIVFMHGHAPVASSEHRQAPPAGPAGPGWAVRVARDLHSLPALGFCTEFGFQRRLGFFIVLTSSHDIDIFMKKTFKTIALGQVTCRFSGATPLVIVGTTGLPVVVVEAKNSK